MENRKIDDLHKDKATHLPRTLSTYNLQCSISSSSAEQVAICNLVTWEALSSCAYNIASTTNRADTIGITLV